MESNQILSKITSSLPFLSKSEKILGQYIIDNPRKVANMSTNSLSKACGVSEPTVIRFTRKMGFSGYRDFKIQLSAAFVSNNINATPVKVNIKDSAFEIYQKLTAFTISSLNSSLKSIDPGDLETAANYIYVAAKQNRQIFLSGMGASTILMRELQIKLMRLNIQTIFFEDIHLRLEACTNLQKDDLFICFTTLGISKENYEMIDIAYEKKAKILVVTQFGNTRIADKADVALYTSVIENNLRLASQTAIVLQSMVVDALFLSIALKDYDTISKSVKESRQKFKELGHVF